MAPLSFPGVAENYVLALTTLCDKELSVNRRNCYCYELGQKGHFSSFEV
jgi:hypothetical protein